jgi:Putative porin
MIFLKRPRIALAPRALRASCLALAFVYASTGAQAQVPGSGDDRQQLEQLRNTTTNLIQALIDSGLLSKDKADELVRKAQSAAAPTAQAPTTTEAKSPEPVAEGGKKNVIRVPYVPESLKNEMRADIKREVLEQARTERWGEPGALPAWLNRIAIEGDVRVRYQMEDWADSNEPPLTYLSQIATPAWSPDLVNTNQARNRMTLRARLGLTSDLKFGFKAGLRLSTGNTGPVSTSQTLGGSDGNFGKYSMLIDRAWLQWEAYVPDLTLGAGRMANPFVGGDLSWSDDINFDGVMANYKRKLDNDRYQVFATAGAFPLQEFETSEREKWLYGVQVGGQLQLTPSSSLTASVAMYDFNGVEGRYDETNPIPTGSAATVSGYLSSQYPRSVRQKGNTLIRINPVLDVSSGQVVSPVWGLASKFKPISLSLAYQNSEMGSAAFKATLDFIKNSGFDSDDISRRAGFKVENLVDKTAGSQLKLQLGSPKQALRGDWQVYLAWRKLERDAWIDAFSDTTWHLGGTNYSGWSLGGLYYVGPRTFVGLKVTSTRGLDDGVEVDGVPNVSSAELKIDAVQLEVNSRF